MNNTTPDRIIELWPSFPLEVSQQIVEFDESSVAEEVGWN